MEGAITIVKKAKKKQVKDEFDRIKQAERKRRRLEKALATSAAIRLELEKKKQRKKELEQERLDEEGARTAEAAALHVLLDQDSDDSCKNLNLDKDEGSTHDIIMGRGQPLMLPFRDLVLPIENIRWVPDARGYGQIWNF